METLHDQPPPAPMNPGSPIMLTAEQEAEFIAEHMRRKERAAAARLALSSLADAEKTPTAASQRRIQAICRTCDESFEGWEATVLGKRIWSQHCQICTEKHDATPVAPDPDREEAWKVACPEAEFRTIAEGGATDVRRLHRDCSRLEQITSWQYGAKGLLIRGDTGKCKTRAVWRVLRAMFDQGKTFAVLSSGRFAREAMDAQGKFTLSEWFDRLAKVHVFVLDDLGKSKWSEWVWGQFFELIDERHKNHRPYIVTTNETSTTMKAKCVDPATWEPLNRRLTEDCTRIVL